jgi:hypothetical protein
VCIDGLCNASICVKFDAEQCELEKGLACQIACIGPGFGDGKTCTSTFSKDTPEEVNGTSLGAGYPCASFTGYCDRSNVCQTVESEDAIKELENLLKNFDSDTIIAWIQKNPAIFGGILGAIVVLCLALYVTRRKSKAFTPEYDPLLDGPRDAAGSGPATDYGGAGTFTNPGATTAPAPKRGKGINRNKRTGTVFENANSKF